jgi:hypothetical protein
MKYQPAMDVSTLTCDQLKRLPIGQWVYHTSPGDKGRFFGEGRTGTVIAWHKRYQGSKHWIEVCRSLYEYGQTVTERN